MSHISRAAVLLLLAAFGSASACDEGDDTNPGDNDGGTTANGGSGGSGGSGAGFCEVLCGDACGNVWHGSCDTGCPPSPYECPPPGGSGGVGGSAGHSGGAGGIAGHGGAAGQGGAIGGGGTAGAGG